MKLTIVQSAAERDSSNWQGHRSNEGFLDRLGPQQHPSSCYILQLPETDPSFHGSLTRKLEPQFEGNLVLKNKKD